MPHSLIINGTALAAKLKNSHWEVDETFSFKLGNLRLPRNKRL